MRLLGVVSSRYKTCKKLPIGTVMPYKRSPDLNRIAAFDMAVGPIENG